MKEHTSFFSLVRRIEGLPILIVMVVEIIALTLAAPTVFGQWGIYRSFLETIPPTLIIGLGLTLVITAGEIDLSFPAIIALSGFAFSWAYKTFDPALGAWLGLVLALVAGALVGYINGILIARVGVPSIMATLASYFFWYGITILLAGGLQVVLKGIQTNLLHELLVSNVLKGQIFGKDFAGIPIQAIWALVLAIFLWFILNRHTFGESVSFIGDNANVARVMGINVEMTKIKLFTIQGIIAAFAGVLVTLDIGVFYPDQGKSYLLSAMASVFVGGTSIAGGSGVMFGTFIGAYVIGSLEAGVVATTISGYLVQVVEGLVMGAIVVLNALISEGRMGQLSNRLRHWGVPIRASALPEVPAESDTAPQP